MKRLTVTDCAYVLMYMIFVIAIENVCTDGILWKLLSISLKMYR